MKFNATNSASLEMKVPKMAAGDFAPHFSVKHMLKDVRIASHLAQKYSLDLPVTEAAGDMLLEEMKHGRGDADYSSVAQKYFPAPAEHEIGRAIDHDKFERAVAPTPAPVVEEEKAVEPAPATVEAAEPLPAEPAPPKEEEEEIPEPVNLSGGFRSWFSHRSHARRKARDAGAV